MHLTRQPRIGAQRGFGDIAVWDATSPPGSITGGAPGILKMINDRGFVGHVGVTGAGLLPSTVHGVEPHKYTGEQLRALQAIRLGALQVEVRPEGYERLFEAALEGLRIRLVSDGVMGRIYQL